MSDTGNISAQVSMLKKMRAEHEQQSSLDKLISQAKIEKSKKSPISPSATSHINNEEQESYDTLIKIHPKKCKPWSYADRDNCEMGNIEDLANSIKSNGQQEPALVRKLKEPDGDVEYEVIFGHRRWLACTLCNTPLLAMQKNINDKDAAVAQKEENENRENLSDYARALNYTKLLANKVFSSESELAANFGIKRSSLGDILAYTKIPPKFMECLSKPHELPKRLAIKIAQITKNITDSELNNLCQFAPLIESGKIPFKKINKELLTNSETPYKGEPKKNDTRVYRNSLAVKLFSSGINQNKTPCFTFSKIVTDNNLLPELEKLVEAFLKEKTEG